MDSTLRLQTENIRDFYLRAQSQAGQKIIDYWKTLDPNLEITQEVLFPNAHPNRNPYSVDLYIEEGHLFIEIDGDKFHQDKAKEKIRDTHIMSQDVHGTATMLRLPFKIPQHLIYGKLTGKHREKVKQEYEEWLFEFAKDALNRIKLEILRKRG